MPENKIEAVPCWSKNSPEKCLVDLGRDARTSTKHSRLVRRKGASWSLYRLSGAFFKRMRSLSDFFDDPVTIL